jgi:hypothetical protein
VSKKIKKSGELLVAEEFATSIESSRYGWNETYLVIHLLQFHAERDILQRPSKYA